MAETFSYQDTTPSVEDLKKQANKLPYHREKKEDKQELSNEQIQQVKQTIKDAKIKNPGVVCERDEVKYLVYLDGCSPEKRQEAIAKLKDHLEKKAKHLEEYTESLQDNFTVEGRLNDDARGLLKKYQGMTGEERKDAAKDLEGLIEARIEEKKTYEEILEDSPHFSESGQLTPAAEILFNDYQSAQEPHRAHLKTELMREIRQLKQVEKQCEQAYAKANDFYEQGKFINGELFLEHIIGLCEEYPDSPRFNVIKEWNERDLENMKDHTSKDRAIQKALMLRDTFVEVEDLDTALKYSRTLVKQTENFLSFTINRNGAEVPRKEKHQSHYLKTLHQDVDHEHRVLLAMSEGVMEKKEEGKERVERAFFNTLTTTAEGDAATVVAASLQEELEKTDVHHRTDDADEVLSLNTTGDRDILHLTEDQLEDSAEEGKPEIVMDLHRDLRHRASIIKRADLDSDNDTAVARQGRLLTTQGELEDAVNKENQKFSDQFVKRQYEHGDIEPEHLENFQRVMRGKTQTGQLGKYFTQVARDQSSPGIRFGHNYEHDKRRHAEDMVSFIQSAAPSQDQDKGKIINFAEDLKQKRQEVRKAS